MLEKQHNRGQDGAGFASVKLNTKPGQRFMHRERSANQNPIQEIFQISNERISREIKNNPNLKDNISLQKQEIPHISELFLGHVRYGTFGKNSKEAVHPFLRQNNWMHRNLIVAGNFNMTNNKELFENLVLLGQHPKEMSDTVTVMEKIGHFLDNQVSKIYSNLKKKKISKVDASPLIEESLNIPKILKKASEDWDGGFVIGGMLGHGDAFVIRDPAGIRPAFYFINEEVVVVASERPVIQTVFNTSFNQIKEVAPGDYLVIKKNGETLIKMLKKSCYLKEYIFQEEVTETFIKKENNLAICYSLKF